jgi:VanZ family protein
VSTWRLLSLWGPVVIFMAAIHVASSMSNPPEPTGVSDKTLHIVTFAMLALVALRALAGGTWRGVTRWTLIGCCAIAVLYGVKDEWQQAYTPGRTSDLMDVVADFAGAASAAIGAGAWSIIRRL